MPKVGLAPKVGDEFYIDTALFVYRGADDRIGGLVRIAKVEKKNGLTWLTLEEFPRREEDGVLIRFGGDDLGTKESLQRQEKLKKKFGNQRACPYPDFRPEFNDSEANWVSHL